MAPSSVSNVDSLLRCEAESILLEDDSAPSSEQSLRLTLAGKLLAAQKPSIANLTHLASRSWDCRHRLSCYDHGNFLYSFEFTHAPDVERVVSGGPWFINGDLLLIDRMNPNQTIQQLPFVCTKLWVRCYDLPPKCFNLKYATAIGNGIGEFCVTDLPSEDPEVAKLLVNKIPTVRKYLRIKINFNLQNPLKRIQLIRVRNPVSGKVEEFTSRLAYERLPATCYRCGVIGHVVESCSSNGPLFYRDWIRAEKFYRLDSLGSSSSSPDCKKQAPKVTKANQMKITTTETLFTSTEILIAPSLDENISRAAGLLPKPLVQPISFGHFDDSLVPFNHQPNPISPKENVHTTVNMSTPSALSPGGVCIGAPAMTSRGLLEKDFEQIGEFLHHAVTLTLKIQQEHGKLLKDFNKGLVDNKEIEELKAAVEKFASFYDVPGFLKSEMKYQD